MIDSIKKLLTSKNSQQVIKIIKDKKKEIEKDYHKNDLVNEEFLFTMLSKGYIDEDYRYYIASFYDAKFNQDERIFISNVKSEHDPDFKLNIEQYESVIKEIRDYQWSNPSVLNNDILTYLIQHKLSDKLDWFINAIQNYYEKYQKNDFVDQYIESINWPNNNQIIINFFLSELIKKLQSDNSTEVKKKLLSSFFSNNTGALFCEMLNICTDIDDSLAKLFKEFLKIRKNFLYIVLSLIEKNDPIKNVLIKISFEIENISEFNSSIQEFLIDNALFQITKENLDFILALQKNLKQDYCYDDLRRYDKIWEKILQPTTINSFIENILLTDNELHYSQYGIVEILFNEKIKEKNATKIIKMIKDESIELEALPKYFIVDDNKLPKYWSNIVFDLLNQNKLDLNFNNILYVYKLYPKSLIQFAQKVFHQMEPLINNKSLNFEKLDKYAKDNYLDEFFASILDNQNIDDDLFEKIVNIMIYHQIKIIELTLVPLTLFNYIPTTKAQILVKLIFKNSIFNKETIDNFLKIIKQCFGDFYQNFNNIKDKCINDWNCKQAWISLLSILLKNKDNNKIDSLIKEISLNDFGDIIKIWRDKDNKLDASNYVKNLLTSKNLDILIKKFGRSAVIEFLDNYKESLDYYIINNIKEDIEQKYNSSADQEPVEIEKSNIKIIFEIAEKYKIPSRAIFDRRIKLKSLFNPLISILQNNSNNTLDWDTISLTTRDIINSVPSLKIALEIITNHPYPDMNKRTALLQINLPKATLRNDLFILGRYFYDNLKSSKIDISKFLSFEFNDLLKISSLFLLQPLVCGTIFEGFFDNTGDYKDEYNPILIQLSKYLDPNSKGYEFIRDCLKPFRSHLKSDIASIFNL